MVSLKPTSTRRRRFSGGNTMVEAAFTLLPTFALIFGFIDVGLMLFKWSTVQNAVREADRYAITFQHTDINSGASIGQTLAIKQRVEKFAYGFVHVADTSPAHIFVCYATTAAPNTCLASGSGGNQPGNIVEVSVKNLSMSWLAPLSGSYSSHVAPFLHSTTPINLNVYATDILGGYPVGVVTVAE